MNQKGFTMLIAVITGTILLLISFGMAGIALKQQILNATARESQTAFYVADSVLDCALYLDTNHMFVGTTDYPPQLPGNKMSDFCGVDILDPIYQEEISFTDEGEFIDPGYNEKYEVKFNKDMCGWFRIIKKADNTTNERMLKTEIKASGYNTCDETSPRRLERGVEAIYFETISQPAPVLDITGAP